MIIDFRWFKFGQNIVQEALVEWHKLLEEDATWELYEDLQCQVSWMNLEDKIYLLWGGGGGECMTKKPFCMIVHACMDIHRVVF